MKRAKKLFLIMLFLITAFNVYISQMFPAHLYQILIDKSPVSSFILLEKLYGGKDYPQQLQFLSNYVGIDFEQHFTTIRIKEGIKVQKLEAILSENPNQPQVLFMLSQEYKKLGNNDSAEEFMRQAHALDPINY